jgi:hypothetical protein
MRNAQLLWHGLGCSKCHGAKHHDAPDSDWIGGRGYRRGDFDGERVGYAPQEQPPRSRENFWYGQNTWTV